MTPRRPTRNRDAEDPNPKTADEARTAGMVRLAAQGATQRFIARVYGVSPATVCRTLRRARRGP